MEEYSLRTVSKVYSYCAKSPLMYSISNFFTFLGRERFLRKKAVEKLDLKEKDKILDLACGMGDNFGFLVKKIGKGKIIGLDYVKGMLKAARKKVHKKGWKNIRLVEKDAAKMHFKKDYFDGIISTIGVSSIPDHKKALKLAVKSLKKGRKMVILEGKCFEGAYGVFNPFLKCLWWSKSWDKNKNILKDVKKSLKNVTVEKFCGGSFYIISGTKG